MITPANGKKVGLVLSGGGARGAYQAGVMKALGEIIGKPEESGLTPISIITGVSAGAINAAYLASFWEDPKNACNMLAQMWSELEAERVFKTDVFSLGRIGMRWAIDASLGAFYQKKMARSLLDTAPLRKLIETHVDLEKVRQNLESGALDALAVSAMEYASAYSISFVQAGKDIPMWDRLRRKSEQTQITADHIMGSSAIPLFFPPVQIGDRHFGDGCVRNIAPLSPAIHLGADRLVVVSVRRPDALAPEPDKHYEPTIARVLGVIMNALLLDSIDLDMERMQRVNNTLNHVPEKMRRELNLRKLEHLWIRPSRDIGHMAAGRFNELPRVMRYLMGGLGSSGESSELTSYLLFEPDFCTSLVELGYHDGLNMRSEIEDFLSSERP